MFDKTVLISAVILFAILGISRAFFDFRIPYLAAIGLYFVIYLIISRLFKSENLPNKENIEEVEWPTSGPIGAYGQRALLLSFTISGLLSLLNPFQLIQIILQAIGNFKLQLEANQANVDAKTYQNQAQYQLPFAGEWFIYNGGITPERSHSWDVLTQRYAYDFVMVNDDIVRHTGRGTQLDEYFCFDQPILAAADGEVVKVKDGLRNAPWLGYGIVDFLTPNFIGNHVIIKHAENEYAVYAHLNKRSIPVSVGDVVKQGQLIGRCGHSGHSSEPHLHFHLQNKANFFFAMGLPIQFADIKIDGETAVNATILSGERVSNA